MVVYRSRKLCASGERGYKIRLPKEWCDVRKLELGQKVYMHYSDQGLIISTEKQDGLLFLGEYMIYNDSGSMGVSVPKVWALNAGAKVGETMSLRSRGFDLVVYKAETSEP